ncbi:unnamed protein product [Cuscuta europaea]|uniref:Uncharacterized protein n=1 Tax=Cuscuta europaea TaxID=41803 RepID=A0A9P1E982_CUSEU|nr:unnamed protein product [Cuscuta europaea]
MIGLWQLLLVQTYSIGRDLLRGNNVCRERELTHENTIMTDMPSSNGLSGNLRMLDSSGSCNTSPTTSNHTIGPMNEIRHHVDLEGAQVGDESNVPTDDVSHHPYTADVRFSYGLRRNRSLRSKQSIEHKIKPQNSLQSCLLAQAYKERAEMEEYIFRKDSSSIHMPRPFLVMDSSQTINRASGDYLSTPSQTDFHRLQKDVLLQENDAVFGIPQLPNIETMKKTIADRGKDHSGSFRRKVNGKHCHSEGSSDGAFLVCLGISVGIFSSLLAHKEEVGKLNGLLKQTENLVQDLQEELEMRDSLTVKELATEDFESQNTYNSSSNKELLHGFSSQKNLNNSSNHCFEEYHCQDSEGESMSKIEAELEAELERLEFNINSFKLEDEYSDVVELDPDRVPDLAEGESRTDVVSGHFVHQPYADQDGSGSSTPHSANYAVSPRELSLRLHQTIQLQLEERVSELEIALEHSQMKVRRMEAQLSNNWRALSSSEVEASPSTKGSPVAKDDPTFINLAGDALDEYSEGFEGTSKTNESETDGTSLGIQSLGPHENMQRHDDSGDWIRKCTIGDENSDVNDEMERLLIRHILQKTMKGSPAVLNAQRAFFYRDDFAH